MPSLLILKKDNPDSLLSFATFLFKIKIQIIALK